MMCTLGDTRLPERFWRNVQADGSSCWLWTGRLDRDGYGEFSVNRLKRRAHRVAWQTLVSPIPNGLVIDHLCCVRGRYRAQYIYVCPACGDAVEPGWLPASSAIDWSIQGQLIGDRAKPLSDKTMARIREGLRRYGHEFVIEAGGNQYDSHDPKHPQYGQQGAYSRSWPTSEPLRTLHTSITKGLVTSLLIPTEGRDGKMARPDGLPLRTQTCRNELAILTTLRGTNAPKLSDQPLDTVAASGTHHGLLVPSGGTWHENAYPTDDAMRTITTRDNHGLLVPYYSGSESAKPTTQPIGTLTTVDRYALTKPPGETIDPNDCTFRMLEPHEIAAGMSFPSDYQWAGTKRDRVRMAGNAVTPPAARDLLTCVAESLGPAA